LFARQTMITGAFRIRVSQSPRHTGSASPPVVTDQ
jgi:hypothetical protein